MDRKPVPLVFTPRYSTYLGADGFHTVVMDVTHFASVSVNAGQGAPAGTGGATFTVTYEESADRPDWSTDDAATTEDDPDEDAGGAA